MIKHNGCYYYKDWRKQNSKRIINFWREKGEKLEEEVEKLSSDLREVREEAEVH